ncbi:hypothetical protein PR048_028658 [Dryococelus australis]|uniref:Uncharacterized protein n=1 Tax=Dryococelus australis TaxID=614101 RepID=A0ABQ9GB63_9NEOP|nr:hypothetical protein PR048_028658 [Dryococelus australis]
MDRSTSAENRTSDQRTRDARRAAHLHGGKAGRSEGERREARRSRRGQSLQAENQDDEVVRVLRGSQTLSQGSRLLNQEETLGRASNARLAVWSDYSPLSKANRVRFQAGYAPGLSQVAIVLDDADGRRVFSGVSLFPPSLYSGAAPNSLPFNLIGFKDLDVKSRPYISTTLSPLGNFQAEGSETRLQIISLTLSRQDLVGTSEPTRAVDPRAFKFVPHKCPPFWMTPIDGAEKDCNNGANGSTARKSAEIVSLPPTKANQSQQDFRILKRGWSLCWLTGFPRGTPVIPPRPHNPALGFRHHSIHLTSPLPALYT